MHPECRFCEIGVTNDTVDSACSKEIPVTNSTIHSIYSNINPFPNNNIIIMASCESNLLEHL